MSASTQKSCAKHLPLRTLVFIFFVFGFLVLTDIFVTSSSRSSILIDVSMRVKMDLSNAFRNLMNQTLNGTINGTLLIQPVGKESASNGGGLTLRINNKVTVQRLNDTFAESDIGQRIISKLNTNTVQYNVLGNPVINGATDNKRKDECNNCFNHNFKYVIDNPDICKQYSGQTEIELLIIILTVHKNIQQRNALRETWLTHTKNDSSSLTNEKDHHYFLNSADVCW